MRKKISNESIAVGVALVLVFVLIFGVSFIGDMFGTSEEKRQAAVSAISTEEETTFMIEDITVGSGREAKAGDEVTVHYTGTFVTGKKFDSSVDRGVPFTFTLGAGRVIAGWDEGVSGMKVGGKRRLTIPPELGYGPNDYGPIPGGSTLLFEVELLGIE